MTRITLIFTDFFVFTPACGRQACKSASSAFSVFYKSLPIVKEINWLDLIY